VDCVAGEPRAVSGSRGEVGHYSRDAETGDDSDDDDTGGGISAELTGKYARGWMVRENGAGKW
jgi:hypothetical protein